MMSQMCAHQVAPIILGNILFLQKLSAFFFFSELSLVAYLFSKPCSVTE